MQRVVLKHTCGPYPGLMQIQGCLDDAPSPLPTYVEPFDTMVGTVKRTVQGASLIKSRPCYVLYREYKPELLGVQDKQNGRGGDNLEGP